MRLYQTFQKALGAVRFSRYNGGRNGGAANDENRGHQGIFQEGSFARRQPGGSSLGGGAALFALNFIIGGLIGGFVLVWRLLVAAWYVPLTIYRLIVG